MGSSRHGSLPKPLHRIGNIWLLPLVLLGLPLDLKAYIDPGSGSMILQALVGGFLVVGAGLRFYWKKITLLMRGSKGDKPQ